MSTRSTRSDDTAGMILRSRHGHAEMAGFETRRVPGGYWLWVECAYERPDLPDWQPPTATDAADGTSQAATPQGHWLAPDTRDSAAADGAVIEQPTPYVWPDILAALAARDRWEHQERQQRGRR